MTELEKRAVDEIKSGQVSAGSICVGSTIAMRRPRTFEPLPADYDFLESWKRPVLEELDQVTITSEMMKAINGQVTS